jgi:uncharacterized protein
MQQQRVELLDAVRGFALMGLFLLHCVELFELYWAHPDPVPGPVFDWTFFLFSGKSFALFALCFGISFHIIMSRAASRGVDFSARFAWRLTILLVIGFLHGLFYRGDILQVLALLGLLLIPLQRVKSNRTLVLIAILCFIQLPLIARVWSGLDGAAWAVQPPIFYLNTTMPVLTDGSLAEVLRANLVDGLVMKWSFYIETGRLIAILGLFIIGMVLGRIGFFAEPGRFVAARRIAFAIAAVAAVAIHLLEPMLLDRIAPEGADANVRQSAVWAIQSWGALAFLTVQVVLFVELYEAAGGAVLKLLAPAGRMTLTLYVGQSLLFVPVFYGFGLGLHDDLGHAETLGMGVVAFALQVAFAHWWFRRFLYGPLEWLWRVLTNTRMDVPFVRREPVAT